MLFGLAMFKIVYVKWKNIVRLLYGFIKSNFLDYAVLRDN